jgi:hypothetical protein
MATRSRIGLQYDCGGIVSVYCHWDGYPEFNGKKLKEHFNTRDKVEELLDGGDMSSLWTNHDFNHCESDEYAPLYYSQRGETTIPRLDTDLISYLSNSEEYSYLFVNGEWVCYDCRSKVVALNE